MHLDSDSPQMQVHSLVQLVSMTQYVCTSHWLLPSTDALRFSTDASTFTCAVSNNQWLLQHSTSVLLPQMQVHSHVVTMTPTAQYVCISHPFSTDALTDARTFSCAAGSNQWLLQHRMSALVIDCFLFPLMHLDSPQMHVHSVTPTAQDVCTSHWLLPFSFSTDASSAPGTLLQHNASYWLLPPLIFS